MTTAMAFVILFLLIAMFYTPVWLPFLISFRVRSPDGQELKWCLRTASLVSLCLCLGTPTWGHDFGDDVAGNLKGASQNFPRLVAWTWGGGAASAAAALVTAACLRRARLRREKLQRAEQPADAESN